MNKSYEDNFNQAVVAQNESRLEEAGQLYREILENQPTNLIVNYNLSVLLYSLGKFDEAETSFKKTIALKPGFTEAIHNLGSTLKKLGRLVEAEASYRKAILLKPDYAEAHYNLGIVLQDFGRFNKAEESYKKAIDFKGDYIEAYNNLGVVLKELNRLDEAELSFRKVTELKPDYVEAHNNLGTIFKGLGRLDEAEASYQKAILLKPEFAEAHNNLGSTLKELDKLEEAEASYRESIKLKPGNIKFVDHLNILLKEVDLLSKISQKKKSIEKNKLNSVISNIRLTSDPVILNRDVEEELIPSLYKMTTKHLNKMGKHDARYGNGKCSFQLFNNSSVVKKVEKDLINIMSQAVKSDIFIMESFFNIFHTSSGTVQHNHISTFDRAHKLVNQKFSLVYYLSVGDQDCTAPGFLKLYNPNEEILPSEGMMVIFPAGRTHSSFYNGEEDRVMIGINFYSLI